MTHQGYNAPLFYLTAPQPCPYLKGQEERKVFTHLAGPQATALNDILSQGGFRRSQNIAYRPACETCRACVSVRISVNEFQETRSTRRVRNINDDLIVAIEKPKATPEQFSLFRSYLDARHATGGMADMSAFDFVNMVEETSIKTSVVEYRRALLPNKKQYGNQKGELLAAALCDQLSDGLSLVYSFFTPDEAKRSLGTYIILSHISRAKELGLPYLYLGYWVKGSPKMQYKTRFQPIEYLGPQGWTITPPY